MTDATARIVSHVTCLGCGCVCDDIALVVQGDQIVEAQHACSLGAMWFGDGLVPWQVRVAGRDASMDEALDVAAQLLARAVRPLVYLAPDLSCEAQREGVAVADRLGAVIDSVTSSTVMSAVRAAQERGRASATLGEVRHRADVLVFWGIDPALRYPRYSARYGPEAAGLHLPNGRRSRQVIAVDIGAARGPVDADLRVEVSAENEVPTLTALTALVAERGPTSRYASLQDEIWLRARELAPTLVGARYAVVVADAEPRLAETGEVSAAGGGVEPGGVVIDRDAGRAEALIALTQALNGPTRCALSTLRAGGNRSGADAVLTWQTGYPAAIDFARGYPRYHPHDGTAAARLGRGDVDAVLILGSASLIPAHVLSLMRGVACIVVGPRASESAFANDVAAIDTAVAGIHEGGTALRMDDVPLPLRASLAGPPAAVDVARALRKRLERGAQSVLVR